MFVITMARCNHVHCNAGLHLRNGAYNILQCEMPCLRWSHAVLQKLRT